VLLITGLLLAASCTKPSQTTPGSPPDESSDDVVVQAGEIIFDSEECTYQGK
jgi:hypothetical protein